MLKSMGADIKVDGDNIEVNPLSSALQSFTMDIPSDPSSAYRRTKVVRICGVFGSLRGDLVSHWFAETL